MMAQTNVGIWQICLNTKMPHLTIYIFFLNRFNILKYVAHFCTILLYNVLQKYHVEQMSGIWFNWLADDHFAYWLPDNWLAD